MKFSPTLLIAALCTNFAATLVAADRVPWTSSHVHGSPEPPLPYRVERAFPKLTFNEPIGMERIPGTDRVIVVEHWGKLWSIPNDESCDKPDLFADLKKFDPEVAQSYGIAFHPNFAENRLAYVFLILDTKNKDRLENGTHIVQFKVTDENPPRLDVSTGKTLYTWMAGGHNGGNLHFGPDGMLYFSTGDASAPDPPDPQSVGQDLGSSLSKIIRIDVDHLDPDKPYGIPKDNPFVDTPGARGEIWAYGFRNPFRMSFDAKTGDLWVGDVGWELWEMVDVVQRGGNYGWSITEAGRQDVHPNGKRGPTPILPHLVTHSHEEAASVIGGEVYYGKKLPELYGAYLYGDWQFGTFWSLRQKDGKVTEHRVLCHTPIMPAGYGITPDGEFLIGDQGAGGLYWLRPNPEANSPSKFPLHLSETGLFSDIVKQTPMPGVTPYSSNGERWADFATGEQWIAVPGTERVQVAGKEQGVASAQRWNFPPDTVFAKTYSIEMEQGNPATRRKLETQLLHYNGIQWNAYSYRWNDAQTDAELLGPHGDEADLQIRDASAPGGLRHEKWRYFSRTECMRCHNLWDNYTPGYSEWQLDRNNLDGSGNQLETLTHAGLAPTTRQNGGLHIQDAAELNARSFLHATCSVCHRNGGGGSVPTFMDIETPLNEARLVNSRPVQGDLGLRDARVVAPGAPTSSVLLFRLTTGGRGHMPYLGAKLVDDQAVILLRDWIAGLPVEKNTPAPVTAEREADAKALAALVSGDALQIDALLQSHSGALALALAVIDGSLKGDLREQAIAKGSAHLDPLERDLFERMLPEEKRRKTLGPDVKADTLLALQGDPARGKNQFSTICAACHRAGELGVDFAPDLTHVSTRLERNKIVERILQPSKNIDPQWELATLVTTEGETLSGFIGQRNDHDIRLRQAGGASKTVPTEKIASLTTAKVGVMPEGLMQGFTAEEAGDLLAFLWSLK